MKALVIGGSYFIGRTLVERLLVDGHDVALVNRGSHPVTGTEQLTADRNRRGELDAVLAGRSFDWVFDMSCYDAKQAASALHALGDRFASWLYLSTAAVYPGGTSTRLGEDEVGPGREWEDYGWNKLRAERELTSRFASNRRHLVILRAPYVYGPRNPLPREAWLWARIVQHRPLWMPRDGATLLHFVHVFDLVDAMLQAVSRPGSAVEVFNVAQDETPTMREYLSLLGDVIGEAPRLREVDYQRLGVEARDFFPFRDFQCLLSTARIEATLQWHPRYDMREGLTQTLSTLDRQVLRSRDVALGVEDRLLASLGDA